MYSKRLDKDGFMLKIGTKAPEFSLPDENGTVRNLSDYEGKKLILYFYPKDNTPGCSAQACGFGELYPQFTEKGVEVVGISKDSVHHIRNLKISIHYLLHCFQTLSWMLYRLMMYGMRKSCTERLPWEW